MCRKTVGVIARGLIAFQDDLGGAELLESNSVKHMPMRFVGCSGRRSRASDTVCAFQPPPMGGQQYR